MNRAPLSIRIEDVRARIFREHTMLRRMVAATIDAADPRFDDTARVEGMRATLRDLSDTFRRHLKYEERAVVPVLRDSDAWGPVRVTHFMDEHHEQRVALAALSEDIVQESRSADELADEVAWFVRGLLTDMDEEESTLSEACALYTCATVSDQTDG